MLLLGLSTLLDFLYGFGVASANRRKAKAYLYLSIINNLGILGFFKYYNFFILEFQKGFEIIGIQVNPMVLNIALPVGISFYTFHGMSYVFDIYRSKLKPVTSFIDYAVFVAFFPLLVAGPIERAHHLLPQVQKPRSFDYTFAINGLNLIAWGFFKKVVVADNLANAVNDIFSKSADLSSGTLIFGAIYFSFQIYCDFSGYSDIARGVAKLFGFDLLVNFNSPYLSQSIPEFWKRWHISLSSWFRDYLYIPLGGSKVGFIKSLRNIFIVFLVSGFWHGANWTFIAWGGIHALFYIPFFIRRTILTQENNGINDNNTLKSYFNIFLTFLIVTAAWIFFRSENLSAAFVYLKGIFFYQGGLTEFFQWRSTSTGGSHIEFMYIIVLYLIAFVLYERLTSILVRISIIILLTLCFGNFVDPSTFIYFQF